MGGIFFEWGVGNRNRVFSSSFFVVVLECGITQRSLRIAVYNVLTSLSLSTPTRICVVAEGWLSEKVDKAIKQSSKILTL